MSADKARFVCPRCQKETLSQFNTSEGVVVDFCEECHGIWFDKDELARYIELSTDIPELEEMQKGARKTDLYCPKCDGFLEELPFSSKTAILIDRCQQCEGIFFDAGELMKAEKASADLEEWKDRLKTVVKTFTEEGYKIIK
jgi:hypothetical protein